MRQRYAALAAFVVTAKRPLSGAQNLNRPLYDYALSLQLSSLQRSPPRRVNGTPHSARFAAHYVRGILRGRTPELLGHWRKYSALNSQNSSCFFVFFVSVRRTVFVSVSAAEAVGFRRADPHGRCNGIKPLSGSASRKSRQRFAAFAAFVVTAKRPLSAAQNFNSPLYDFNYSLQLSRLD